jgi:PBSX family phage terminase large subunit
MQLPIPVNDVYKPLYTSTKPIILLTGGRGGAKSFNGSLFIKRLTYEINHTILYTRYTMASAEKSVIPEFQEKIDLEGDYRYFDITAQSIVNKGTQSKILFSGIKTSSGNQTAKLKSIQGLSTFVVDEGEEWQNEEEYDKISLSIRKKGVQNRIITLMNPASTSHFIYKKYIKDTHKIVVIDGVPVQISTHPDVLHIHSTYLDNIEHLSEKFIKEVEEIKRTNLDKYAHIIIGRWNDGSTEDSLFNWERVRDLFIGERQNGSMYIVCDAAKYGRDYCVTMVFRGWEVLHISVLKKSDVHDVLNEIEKLRGKFNVPKLQCLVDGDGVGSDAVKMGGYRAFHGGAKPIATSSAFENYKNLKTQCAFHLAENIINKGLAVVHVNNQTVTVDGSYTSKIKQGATLIDVEDLIKEDLRAIKYSNVDGEGKKCINTKDEQKIILGRSPDFFDTLNMRCLFDFVVKSEYL